MKIHAARYALTSAVSSVACSTTMIALDSLGLLRFPVAIGLALFVGLLSYAIVPYNENASK